MPVRGDWPEDLAEAGRTAFAGRLEAAELDQLAQTARTARHPYGWLTAGSAIATLILSVLLARDPTLVILVVALGLAATVWAGLSWRRHAKILTNAKRALGAHVRSDVLDVRSETPDPRVLDAYRDMGAFGAYDDIARLTAYGPEDVGQTRLISARLTREERHSVPNGDGGVRTETRTVTVFDGILFDLVAPDANGPSRTIVTSRGVPRPTGRFKRVDPNSPRGRAVKLKTIKPASGDFNRLFKVRADDSVMGHVQLDPDDVMRWLNLHAELAEALDRRKVGLLCLMTRGRAHIAIDGQPRLGGHLGDEDLPLVDGKLQDRIEERRLWLSIPALMARHLDWPVPAPFSWET